MSAGLSRLGGAYDPRGRIDLLSAHSRLGTSYEALSRTTPLAPNRDASSDFGTKSYDVRSAGFYDIKSAVNT